MHLRKGKFPGIKELTNVGWANDYHQLWAGPLLTMQQKYDKVMSDPKCDMVVASLNAMQTAGIKCLRKNGFKQVGPARRNPNTSNLIILLAKRIRKKAK